MRTGSWFLPAWWRTATRQRCRVAVRVEAVNRYVLAGGGRYSGRPYRRVRVEGARCRRDAPRVPAPRGGRLEQWTHPGQGLGCNGCNFGPPCGHPSAWLAAVASQLRWLRYTAPAGVSSAARGRQPRAFQRPAVASWHRSCVAAPAAGRSTGSVARYRVLPQQLHRCLIRRSSVCECWAFAR